MKKETRQALLCRKIAEQRIILERLRKVRSSLICDDSRAKTNTLRCLQVAIDELSGMISQD